MATVFLNKSAVLWAQKTAIISPPFVAEWEGFFSFGINAATSIRNLIQGKSALSIIGSPAYGPNYIELTGAQIAYLVTAIKNTADMTIVATVMPLEDKATAIVSNYQSARRDGAGLCIGTQLGFHNGVSTTDNNVSTTFNHGVLINNVSSGAEARTTVDSPINKWYLISGRVKNSARVRSVNNLTAGTFGTNTPQLNDPDLGDVLRIGSSYNSQYPGKVRLSELAIFSESLSDDNFSAVVQWMRERSAMKGIAV